MEFLEGTIVRKDFLNKKYIVKHSNGKEFKVDQNKIKRMDEPHVVGVQDKISLKDLPLVGGGCK